MNRKEQHLTVQNEAHNLFIQKNKDYGDSFATYGTIGVIVRMGDKIQRLMNITKNGINLVETESLRDTLIDLHNYAAMAIMLMDENTNKDIIWSVSDDSGPSGDEGPSSIKNLLDKLAD